MTSPYRFSVLCKPTGCGWIVRHAATLPAARREARTVIGTGAMLFWITDHRTGARFTLRGRLRAT